MRNQIIIDTERFNAAVFKKDLKAANGFLQDLLRSCQMDDLRANPTSQSDSDYNEAILKKPLNTPLNIDYNDTQVSNIRDQLTLHSTVEQPDLEGYKTLLNEQRAIYCASIQEETKNLRVIGAKIIIDLIPNKEERV